MLEADNMSKEEIISAIQKLIMYSKDKKDVLYNLDKKYKQSLERYFRFI